MTDPNWPVWLYVTAWLLPLAAFVLLVLGGKHWGKLGAYVACAAILSAFVLSCWGFYLYAEQAPGLFSESAGGHGVATRGSDYSLPKHGSQLRNPLVSHAASDGAGEAVAARDESAFFEEAPYPGPPVIADHSGTGGHGTTDAVPWKWDFTWMQFGARVVRIGFYVDNLTAIMFLMVTMISSLIFIYSIGYMHQELHDPVHDPVAVPPGQPPLHRKGRFPRFFTYLSLFCFSMLGLVIADNIFMVFIFWELVGICSYLLIGFYYERKSASTAANKAFITNRVGDAGMIVGLMIIWTSIGTFNIQDVVHSVRDGSGRIVRVDTEPRHPVQLFDARSGQPLARIDPQSGQSLAVTIPYGLLVVAGIGVFIGCVGKSAQFPLHVWLPDAMEGPTPVSALIHAATMVAAGVYLVGRFYGLFAPEALLFIAYTGGITLFLAGTIALVMTDIKRVLAYSTVSQLGYMMLGLGVGGWAAGLFHLLTHAFFKALLFLCSGSVIHGTGTQEMPQMGGLWRKMPITALTMLAGVLAICGIPLFSGYYSKDAIVAHAMYFGGPEAWGGQHPQHILLFVLPAAGAAITAFYMFRLYFMTFTGEPRDDQVHEHAHESPAVMWLPLAILAVSSVIVGYSLSYKFWGGTPLLEQVLSYGPPHVQLDHPTPAMHDQAGKFALFSVLGGIALSALFYYFRVLNPDELQRQVPRIHDFLVHKWYFDELYDAVLVRPVLAIARSCRNFDWNVIDSFVDGTARNTLRFSFLDGWFDLRIIDGIANWISDGVYATGNWLRRWQTGQLRQYVVFLVVAAVGLFAVIAYLAPYLGPNFVQNLIAK